uniref:Uncharacterized protein n=1 Tax=Leviviridae sp. TaxID=2027243 RepID=A0A514D2J1_9VIRU|nr:MAG: hypothetical protein H1Bulk28FD40_000002 [Leviviridae sp.]
MSLSYEITHVSANSTESVTTLVADKSGRVFTNVDSDPKTGRITATYTLASGDVNHPATVEYAVDPIALGAKNRYGSVTFRTWNTVTDSVSGEIKWWPIQATVSFVIASGAPVQLADFNKLIACAFSYTYASVASGVRDTAWLQNLLFGSPVQA